MQTLQIQGKWLDKVEYNRHTRSKAKVKIEKWSNIAAILRLFQWKIRNINMHNK